MNSEMWDWQGQDCVIIEDNTSFETFKYPLNELYQNEGYLSCTFDDMTTTPVKACGDLAYNVAGNQFNGKESEPYIQPSSQVKRRRMLQFDSEFLDSPLFIDEMFLRSEETQDCLEDAISDMSEWVAGFTEGSSQSTGEYLDPSSEGWIADCFNDAENYLSTENIASGESDVQINITEVCNTPSRCHANAVNKLPVHTGNNNLFKGRKSYMHTPPKLASSIIYPFTFIKPCSVHGDVTLKDINQRIHTPIKSKQNEQDDPFVSYQTSAFSGKPVVRKTKIQTEGGEGSITIVRTKG